jgi:hypothetical protein
MYRVLIERAAEKDLSRLSPQIHDRVMEAIQGLATVFVSWEVLGLAAGRAAR